MIPLCPLCLTSGLLLNDPPSLVSPFTSGYYTCPRCRAAFSLHSAVEASTHGMTCRACGCSDLNPCSGGCSWVAIDLCSACDDPHTEQRTAHQV